MARQKEGNTIGVFSRRDILSTAAVAGGMLTASSASIAQTADQAPKPSREPGVGGTDPVPGDVVRERQNRDMLNPPATDSGTTPNLRFSFADAHVRQSSGGWTRQVTARELGVSKSIAGVNMRLNAGASGSFTGTSRRNGPTCSMERPASRRSTPRVEILSTTSASATSGISPAAFPIRFRALVPTVASFYWSSMMATSTKTALSC